MDPNLICEAVTAMLNYFWGVAKHLFRMKIIHVILIVLFTKFKVAASITVSQQQAFLLS